MNIQNSDNNVSNKKEKSVDLALFNVGYDIIGENIPEELKKINRWVNWKYNDKKSKIPIQLNDKFASSTDPATWTTFQKALDNARVKQIGIGFVVTKDDKISAIDIDHVIKDGEIEPLVQELIDMVNSYTEVSPSGEGIRIFVLGDIPSDLKKTNEFINGKLEFWDTGRYLTVTGHVLKNVPIVDFDYNLLKRYVVSEKKNTAQVRGRAPTYEQIKEMDRLLETMWDQDRPEEEGSHRDTTLEAAALAKQCGVDGDWFSNHMVEFTKSHPCQDGKIHDPKDLQQAVEYVFKKGYSKEIPGFSKKFRRDFISVLKPVKRSNPENERGELIISVCKRAYSGYFKNENTSLTADRIDAKTRFKAITRLGEGIEKGTLYRYDSIYIQDGITYVSVTLEAIRRKMATRFAWILKRYSPPLKIELKELRETLVAGGLSEDDRDWVRARVDALTELLEPVAIILTQHFRNEVVNSIIASNICDVKTMNPKGYIPFRNGLLSLTDWQLKPFTPELFYTYKIEANHLNRHVTLRDAPMFNKYINEVYYPDDIPMILSYYGYSLQPSFPVHKVLFVVGKERIGKGTGGRIMKGLLGKGYGVIELHKILLAERFQFSGLMGKNLYVDSEITRKFRRGTVADWRNFNSLFGGDVISNEEKGHEVMDWVSLAKGMFFGNLPLFFIDNPAAISRILMVVTKDAREGKRIPDLDVKILDAERDEIATLLTQALKGLVARNYVFPGEKTNEETAEIIEKLADPVSNFQEELMEPAENHNEPVVKVYEAFTNFCEAKGIPVMSKQTFTRKMGFTYPKKKVGDRNDRYYAFVGCVLSQSEEENTKTIQVGHG